MLSRLVFLLAVMPFGAVAAGCPGIGPADRLPSVAQDGPIFCNHAYAVQVSPETRDPIWSAEHLTRASVRAATALHGRDDFHPDDRLPMAARATLADYKRSGWSRGHMTPSGDMPDPKARAETYALSNIVPQSARLNSGAWDHIEHAVRQQALRDGEIYVVTGPAFREDRGTIGIDDVRVPSSVWKAAYDPAANAIGVIVCKNTTHPTCDQVDLAALYRVTGIDPFPGAPSSARTHRLSIAAWTKETTR
ncbi:endonuclease [Neoasaia chiangmaiensis NBRC 101099]|uniref:Uncharacterized protein n=1 Tax=Neoasaia chiangmaiensis TaxID=320497 RepID=A0A1U9KR69_9PROT|nr:DNA/RNA non-specific endonuclease [Neoasaia chiangmaiensis]AQS88296.1 hypothetical protein A0U93_10455 [Neoasaia chiangmaiensis]GBR39619.1 endonuclease [Neoasaia chiangmaiensis NBRC 101099]GEN14668.1 hypothetical protein NCH01_10990 [Neoasaia chiangmaiensis]